METTFMTIHNLTPDANILFASDSIIDILGYRPDEVVGTSCFDYFHPDEVPFARRVRNHSVQLEKAAVLHYAQIRARDGRWIGCECVFTVTYDVLVACTSIYHANEKSDRRATDATVIRHLFTSPPRDPRYHMLEHLSSKFRALPSQREPRAAIILNRFTRTLTVMYATDAISNILGITAEQFKDKSFYECIQENCLLDAIRCLESAKANDSIAYLRFWYRDPRRVEDFDEEMREASVSSDSEDGGVELHGHMDIDPSPSADASGNGTAIHSSDEAYSYHQMSGDHPIHASTSPPVVRQNYPRTPSGESSTDPEQDALDAIFDRENTSRSSTSSLLVSPENGRRATEAEGVAVAPPVDPFEIEAVVSCTSDGLVVVLRRARPVIPSAQASEPADIPLNPRGLFAAPWGANPIRPHQHQPDINNPFKHGFEAPVVPAGGLPVDDFMNSIREVAVFAWSLTGINGNIASYGHGVPRGEAQPPAGLPVWDPYAQPAPDFLPPVNQAEERWIARDDKTNELNNLVTFQHPREKQTLEEHNSFGYGNNPMRSNQPGFSAHRYLGNLTGYAYQGPGAYEHNQYNNFSHQVQGQMGWSVDPPTRESQPPTTQPQGPSQGQGPSDGTRGNRYLWY